MKTKEEILKEFLSPDRQSKVGYLPITADALKLELLADIRDGLGSGLAEIVRLLKEIEYFERTKGR